LRFPGSTKPVLGPFFFSLLPGTAKTEVKQHPSPSSQNPFWLIPGTLKTGLRFWGWFLTRRPEKLLEIFARATPANWLTEAHRTRAFKTILQSHLWLHHDCKYRKMTTSNFVIYGCHAIGKQS
jgi:hypothetical protein